MRTFPVWREPLLYDRCLQTRMPNRISNDRTTKKFANNTFKALLVNESKALHHGQQQSLHDGESACKSAQFTIKAWTWPSIGCCRRVFQTSSSLISCAKSRLSDTVIQKSRSFNRHRLVALFIKYTYVYLHAC